MKQLVFASLAGACFGAGLALSGMTNPALVLAFLTLNASWNPTLIVVMGSAVVVSTAGFAYARRRAAPLADTEFHEPQAKQIDVRLLVGSAVFGVGWGLSGYCPGPAFVGAASLDYRALAFLAAFIIGLMLFELTLGRSAAARTAAAPVSSDG